MKRLPTLQLCNHSLYHTFPLQFYALVSTLFDFCALLSLALPFAYCRHPSKALQLECIFVPAAVVVVVGVAVAVGVVGGCALLAGWLLFCCVVSLEYDAACLCMCVFLCAVFSLAEPDESGWLFAGPDDCYSLLLLLLFFLLLLLLLCCYSSIRRSLKLHTFLGFMWVWQAPLQPLNKQSNVTDNDNNI